MTVDGSQFGQNAVLVAIILSLVELVKYAIGKMQRPKEREASGGNGHSGSMPVSFWKEEFRIIVEEALGKEFQARNETIRMLFRQEFDTLMNKIVLALRNKDS